MSTGISITPSKTIFFNIPPRTKRSLELDNHSRGSRKSMQRMRRCLEFFWLFAKWHWAYGKDEHRRFKFRMAFITLTLSSEQRHTDDYVKIHMLQPFLKWAFREGKDRHYVWKAEVQENGNIHFHITFNGFLHYLKIREKWNHLQWKHGYIAEHADPNSTDVHSVKNTAGFVSYMVKYMSKVKEERSFRRVSDLFPFKVAPQLFALQMGSICAGGVPFYKREVEGKHWAADRGLLNCKASVVGHIDTMSEAEGVEYINKLEHVWNEHLPLMRCKRIKTDQFILWQHEKDITVNSQLSPLVADLFGKAYESFIGLS